MDINRKRDDLSKGWFSGTTNGRTINFEGILIEIVLVNQNSIRKLIKQFDNETTEITSQKPFPPL